MKKLLVSSIALATVLASLASPAFAASSKHRAPVANEASEPYAQGGPAGSYARNPDVVTFGNHVVGEDPDQNIRTQLLRDPEPSEY